MDTRQTPGRGPESRVCTNPPPAGRAPSQLTGQEQVALCLHRISFYSWPQALASSWVLKPCSLADPTTPRFHTGGRQQDLSFLCGQRRGRRAGPGPVPSRAGSLSRRGLRGPGARPEEDRLHTWTPTRGADRQAPRPDPLGKPGTPRLLSPSRLLYAEVRHSDPPSPRGGNSSCRSATRLYTVSSGKKGRLLVPPSAGPASRAGTLHSPAATSSAAALPPKPGNSRHRRPRCACAETWHYVAARRAKAKGERRADARPSQGSA